MSSTIASLETTRNAVRRMVKQFVEDAAVGDVQPQISTLVYCQECYDLAGLRVLLNTYTHPPVPVTVEAREHDLRMDPGPGPSRNYAAVQAALAAGIPFVDPGAGPSRGVAAVPIDVRIVTTPMPGSPGGAIGSPFSASPFVGFGSPVGYLIRHVGVLVPGPRLWMRPVRHQLLVVGVPGGPAVRAALAELVGLPRWFLAVLYLLCGVLLPSAVRLPLWLRSG